MKNSLVLTQQRYDQLFNDRNKCNIRRFRELLDTIIVIDEDQERFMYIKNRFLPHRRSNEWYSLDYYARDQELIAEAEQRGAQILVIYSE